MLSVQICQIAKKWTVWERFLASEPSPFTLDDLSIARTSPSLERSLAIYSSSPIEGYRDDPGLDRKVIERRKGFMGKSQLEKN